MYRLITGGSGFLADELIERLGAPLRIVARNEGNLLKIKEKYEFVEIVTGDISDPIIAKKVMEGVDEVYHAAAFKHVALAQTEAYQCVMSNVVGTLNLLKESFLNGTQLFVFISTDKAAKVTGVYGATKYLGERLVEEFEKMNKQTRYRIVRYGNILNSTGSFLPKWKEKMEKKQEIIITDPEATRFFWTKKEAVDLIFKSVKDAKDSTPLLPNIKAVKMGVMLEACQELYGECAVKEIGLQPGENLHETMDGIIFSNAVEQYTKEEVIDKLKDV